MVTQERLAATVVGSDQRLSKRNERFSREFQKILIEQKINVLLDIVKTLFYPHILKR